MVARDLGRIREHDLFAAQLPRRCLAAMALAWLPLAVTTAFEQLDSGLVEPLLRDLSVHTRLLLALPLLLLADARLTNDCRDTLSRLFAEQLVPPGATARVRALIARVTRVRASRAPDLLFAVLAFGGAAAAQLGMLPSSELLPRLHGEAHRGFADSWLRLVSLPLFQLALWRALFHWLLWTRLLAGLTRAPLLPAALHGDRRGGLAFLVRPALGFGALVLFALGAVLASRWLTEALATGVRIDRNGPLYGLFLALGLATLLAPYCAFAPSLFRARLQGRKLLSGLNSDYARRFAARWAPPQPRDELLGNADMQSLNDLTSAYRETVGCMQLVPFSGREALLLAVAGALPTIPALLAQVPATELLRRVLSIANGNLPS